MGLAVLIAKVKDYDKWEPTIMEDIPLLKANGAISTSILRDLDDPNRIIVTTKFKNIENAKKFAAFDELHARMQAGGVIGKPEIYFVEEKKVF